MSAMLHLLPKIPQNILTQNCFYYNILQLLFPFWHVFFCIFRHFSCQRNLFTVSLANLLCFNTMPYFAGIDRHVPHTTQHGFGTVQSRHVKKTYLKNRKNVVFTPTERQTKFAKTSDRIHKVDCLATLGEKMQEKQKKCHIRLLSTAPPLPQKRKQNTHRSFGKFFAYCSFPKNSVNVTQKFAKTSDRLHKVDSLATLGEKMQEKQKTPHKTAFK